MQYHNVRTIHYILILVIISGVRKRGRRGREWKFKAKRCDRVVGERKEANGGNARYATWE